MAKPNDPPIRIAVDTNIALDLAIERELVFDALETIRARASRSPILVPPSVAQELAFIASEGDVAAERKAAALFLQNHRTWRFQLMNYVPFGEEFVERVARRIRQGLLPESEVHDSFILAESALLGCAMLLTSDEHLRSIDFQRLTFELQTFDIGAPVIATPREIVRKFFR